MGQEMGPWHATPNMVGCEPPLLRASPRAIHAVLRPQTLPRFPHKSRLCKIMVVCFNLWPMSALHLQIAKFGFVVQELKVPRVHTEFYVRTCLSNVLMLTVGAQTGADTAPKIVATSGRGRRHGQLPGGGF